MDEKSSIYNYTQLDLKEIEEPSKYQGNRLIFWVFATAIICIGLIAVVANGIVLYITTFYKNNGPLKSLDSVIKSLAVADMLFGLIGIPCRLIAFWNIGSQNNWLSFVSRIFIITFKFFKS